MLDKNVLVQYCHSGLACRVN